MLGARRATRLTDRLAQTWLQSLAMKVAEDTPLILARQRLDRAVHDWADPQPRFENGRVRWSDRLYDRLRGALKGSAGVSGHRVPGSRMPCVTAVLALLVEVDTVVASWESDAVGTVDKLHKLIGHGFRPQDVSRLDSYSEQLEKWATDASELVGDAAVVLPLRVPCPSCGQRYVYRRSRSEETVRSDCLRVSESGAECLGCRAVWEPAEFHWLARLLGCAELPV